ncbi:Uncharacterised protein [uncultured archaeon]|nr:Uncharacterised protein [uncultured archaeon]
MGENNKSDQHGDCFHCGISQFGNFNYNDDNLKGGELFVLKESILQNKLTPCELSSPLDCCFKVWFAAQQYLNEGVFERSINVSIANSSNSEINRDNIIPLIEIFGLETTPLLFFLYSCFSDLKASMFLAFTGHYRSAIQLLRPVMENVIVGQCQEERIKQATRSNNIEKKLNNEYDKFFKSFSESDTLNFNSSTQYLFKRKILVNNDEKQLRKLWMKLNEYLHPYSIRWSVTDNPATTYFDRKQLNRWIYFYEEILAYILEILYNYYPMLQENQIAKESLIELSGWYSNEIELKRSMIKSRRLKTFIQKYSSHEE